MLAIGPDVLLILNKQRFELCLHNLELPLAQFVDSERFIANVSSAPSLLDLSSDYSFL